MPTFTLPQQVKSLARTLDTRFAQALNNTPSIASTLAMETRSNNAETVYPFIAGMPGKLREWVGERVKQGGKFYEYRLGNKLYEGTMSVRRVDVEDSNLDLAGYMATQMGREVALWPEQLITNVIENGTSATTALTYDSVAFFSASHPVDPSGVTSGTQSNLYNTANGGTRPLSAANLAYGMTAISSLKAPDGTTPLLQRPRLALMVPIALEWTAKTIVNQSTIAPTSGVGVNVGSILTPNVLAGAVDVIVNPYLTSATAWYLFDLSQSLKPFILQRRTEAEFCWKNQASDDNVFGLDEYIYGTRVRGNAGYGNWFQAVKLDT